MMIKTIEELNREFLTEFDEHSSFADYVDEKSTNEIEKEPPLNKKDNFLLEENPVNHTPASGEPKESRGAERVSAAHAQPIWKDLLFLTTKIIMIMLVFVALFTFLFGLLRYGEPSMVPSIKDGDLVIYYRYTKVGYLPQDTIILEHEGQKQARRVVATAGDVVNVTDDGLLVNGALQQEPEIYQKTDRYAEGVTFPLVVPEGHVFVLGDARTDATDSRVYGPVRISDTFGKVMAIIRRRSI